MGRVSRRDCYPGQDKEMEWVGLFIGMGDDTVGSSGTSGGE